jgi:lipase chaperone LimK
MGKPKVIKDFDKLDASIQEQIMQFYPDGFDKHLVKFTNADGKNVSALPFETDDRYYLVRMTANEARQIFADEEDFDSTDLLKAEIKDEFKEEYDSDEQDEKDDYDDDGDDDYGDDDSDEDGGNEDDY